LKKTGGKAREEEELPDSIFEACISLILKPEKHRTKIENYKPIPMMNIEAKC
jgi:hypothetical protein